MQKLTFSKKTSETFNVLCLGAHCDDIEIGCGGTLLKLIDHYEQIRILWIVFASNQERKREALNSAEMFLENAHEKDVRIFDFRDGYLPSVWGKVKDTFETLKQEIEPDLIFTHYRNDWHQDHRTLNKLTWNTFRSHLILEYEIPKYDGDLGNPQVFIPLETEYLEKKQQILHSAFKSQLDKHWFDETFLMSILRIRGVQSATELNYAEAFYIRKLLL